MIPCVVKSWMLNLIFDIRWPYFLKFWLIVFNLESWDAKYDDFVIWWPLNTKYDIWLFFSSMTLECEIWYMMSSSFDDAGYASMTLECELWYMMILCFDDPWMWIMIYGELCFDDPWIRNMIYDGILPRWSLIAKYDIEFIWL
jgi:hypothetical protein